ncbi:AAA family ATPase [Ruminococcus sp. NK3A76]|uniref:AAA family ATPase n=1 Tax=Ruminococcus sp. NK3A76 TaxID=877411 RepID=UPI000689DD8F|nr:AAA family ATPase [Ruminococcus sp. NK3A76]
MINMDMQTIPLLSVNEMCDQLSRVYISVISKGEPFKLIPSIMLWDAPGVGKSQGIRQLADTIQQQTGKKVCVTDVRLLLFNPIDLRGIPAANADRTLAVWLRPKIFQMDDSNDIINILFLDEISAAPQSVQAAAYQITLDRTVGEHRLPDNCIVIAAGNRITDRSVVFKMPRALANRLCHIEICCDHQSWKQWALSADIDPRVIGFISFSQKSLLTEDPTELLAFTTPRSWEMVSHILDNSGGSIDEIYPMIAGCIGSGAAIEFQSWCRIWDSLPDIDPIFEGAMPTIPQNTDVMYAVSAELTYRARKRRDDLAAISNSIRFIGTLPPEFATMILRDYMGFEENYRSKLITIPEFADWIRKNGRLLTDA